MKRLIFLFLILISINPLIAQNLEINGKLNDFFTYNYYNTDSDLYTEDMGDYFLENILELNTKIRLANTLFTYGLFDLDIQFSELMDEETNQSKEEISCELNQAFINILLADWLYLEAGKKTIDLFFLTNPFCAELGIISDWFMLDPFVIPMRIWLTRVMGLNL